jgi:hypothetical protein
MKRKQKIKALCVGIFFFIFVWYFLPDAQDEKGNFDLASFLTKLLLFTIVGVAIFYFTKDRKNGI